MSETTTTKPIRYDFLDWTRGLAGLIMLFGHTMHSFTRPEEQSSSLWVMSQFFGGMAPALFLFLTGATLAFMMESRSLQALPPLERWRKAARRGGYILLLAFGFRFQMWLFGQPYSPWSDLFKVDVLNCMGIMLLALSPLAMLPSLQRIEMGLIIGSAVSLGAPIMTGLDLSALPVPIRDYLKPDYNHFSLFPWSAFIAYGLASGTILKGTQAHAIPRGMQWWAIVGFGLIMLARQFSDSPYNLYPHAEFWLDAPGLTYIKLGTVLVVVSVGYLWTRLHLDGFSIFRLIGTHSLLVYWVHIELVYGRPLWFWKNALSAPQAALAGVVVIILMVGTAYLWEHRSKWLGRFRRVRQPAPSLPPA